MLKMHLSLVSEFGFGKGTESAVRPHSHPVSTNAIKGSLETCTRWCSQNVNGVCCNKQIGNTIVSTILAPILILDLIQKCWVF